VLFTLPRRCGRVTAAEVVSAVDRDDGEDAEEAAGW
jgi:hypothetical protein